MSAVNSWSFNDGTNPVLTPSGVSTMTMPAGTEVTGVPAQSTFTGDLSTCNTYQITVRDQNGNLVMVIENPSTT
jgi:hypothetical protein